MAHDIRGDMTRASVARALGISISTVRRLEDRGVLHPWVDPENQQRFFDAAEVETVRLGMRNRPERSHEAAASDEAQASDPCLNAPAADPAADATVDPKPAVFATVFDELDAGAELTSIVRKHRLSPRVVRACFEEWVELKSRDLNSPSVPKTLAGLQEAIAEVADLLDGNLTAGLPARFECSECGTSGLVAAQIKCTACGQGCWWGFHGIKEEDYD